MDTLQLLLRGLAVGAVLTTGIGLLRSTHAGPARWVGAVFCLSVAAFGVHSGGAETRALHLLGGPIWLLSVTATAWFWLFAVTLFEDRGVTLERLAPVGIMTAVATVGAVLPRPASDGAWIVHNLLQVVLVSHVVRIIWLSWGGDLVEARRSLRGPFMVAVAVYCIFLSGFEIAGTLGFHLGWGSLVQALSLAIMTLAGAATLLQGRPDLFESAVRRPAAAAEAVAPQDRPDLARLQTIMADTDLWRREGLTIGQLASELGVPEHRLRRLINGGLGHRNFADFLNARRIDAAKAALAAPDNARASISALAFELGYGSLGPFNRAFKDATGLTPSAWRLRALAASPNPEKTG
ncbi:MAG TPA: AraC family transcriptional regulator [Caulobacter sp.]|nr:AraC family transcriptional regulator [Caulobacter sp.]